MLKCRQGIVFGALISGFLSQQVQADAELYGKIHLSGDAVSIGDATEYALASNSSRIGFKGSESASTAVKVVWKLESEIDVSGEKGDLKARNRYLGLVSRYGMLLGGYHDTPNKTLGSKVEVFADTIADRRAVIGNGNGEEKTDVRAANAIMYVSPKIAGMEVRLMQSTGTDLSSNTGGDNGSLFGASVIYKTRTVWAGLGFENNDPLGTSNTRIAGGINLLAFRLNGIYEILDSDQNAKRDRSAYGFSLAIPRGQWTMKAQAFWAGEYSGDLNSNGALYALGVSNKLGEHLALYTVVAMADNNLSASGSGSKFPLAGSGHGDSYMPASGDDVFGISAGAIYVF